MGSGRHRGVCSCLSYLDAFTLQSVKKKKKKKKSDFQVALHRINSFFFFFYKLRHMEGKKVNVSGSGKRSELKI